MANYGIIIGPIAQSQAGQLFITSGVWMESALQAVGFNKRGIDVLKQETERRLPGNTVTVYGRIDPTIALTTAGATGTGGTAMLVDTFDPTAGPGDDTAIAANDDARFSAIGTIFMNSIDSILAANTQIDKWIALPNLFQTFDIAKSIFSIVNITRALSLTLAYVGAKLNATGKPYRMIAVQPGFSVSGAGSWSMGLLHEAIHHLAQNGRTSTRASISGFSKISNYYIGPGANQCVASDDAEQADNVYPQLIPDFSHQSNGSSNRLCRQIALSAARFFDSSVTQEYNDVPSVLHAYRHPTDPLKICVRFQITPGNRLVWPARPSEDAASWTLEGSPNTIPSDQGHFRVNAHPIYPGPPTYQRTRSERIPITAITLNHSMAHVGYAVLELTLAAPATLGSTFSIQPGETYRRYWRQTEPIPNTQKNLAGLREEAGATPYVVSGACEDLLITGRTFMTVPPVTDVPIQETDPLAVLQHSVTVRNAQLDAIETTIGTAPTLKFFTGPPPATTATAASGTELASYALPSDWLAAASSGAKAKAGTWAGNATAVGDIGYFRIIASGTCHQQGIVTLTGGGGAMTVADLRTVIGQPITVTSYSITAGNA